MTFAVLVEPTDDEFAASIAGVPGLRVTGASREAAIAALREKVSQSIERGELTTVEIDRNGLSSLFGKYADDPTLQEICDEAYRARDAELD